MHVTLGPLLLSLHVDIRSFLIFFIVIFKADIHYCFFPALSGIAYVENRKESLVSCLQGDYKSCLIWWGGRGP